MTFHPRTFLAQRVYYGWVIVIACFLASVTVFGTSYAFSVFYDAFIDDFDASISLLAFVFGLQTALLYITAVGAGRLVDKYGQRRVTAASSTILVIGLVWTAFAQSFLELLAAFGIVAAVGMAGLYIVSYATLPSWFDRRLGTAAGLASTGNGIGLVIVPPGANAAISVFGWRTAMLAVAFIAGIFLLIVLISFADDPNEVEADQRINSEATDRDNFDGGSKDAGNIHRIITSRSFLLVFLGWIFVFAPMYIILSHGVQHAANIGLGRSTGVLAIAVIGIATTTARIGVGVLSDQIGRPQSFVACGALLGGATTGIGVASTTSVFIVAIAALGIGYGGCGGLLGAVTADLFGNRSLNTLFAVLSLSFAISGLLAPPLAGLWFEIAESYRLVFIASGIIGIGGSGCMGIGIRINDYT